MLYTSNYLNMQNKGKQTPSQPEEQRQSLRIKMPNILKDTVRSLINFLSRQGLSRAELLRVVSLSETELNQTGELIDTAQYEKLYQYAEQQLGRRTIGFEFGQSIDADRWGILGYIAFTAPSIKVALEHQRRFQTLVGNLGTPIQELHQGQLCLKWMPAYHCSHHTVEEILTGWTALAMKLSRNPIKPTGIFFSHDAPNDVSFYRDFFQCDVQFNCDYHGILVSSDHLDIPFTRHDPTINQLLIQQATKHLNTLAEKLPVEVVTKFITNQLPLGVPEIDDAARHLQISVRTLQRKLSEHQLTFSGLIDHIRKELALSYLKETNTRVVYIAQMLGFSEQSAFQRAFKRWTEKTPKQYRDQLVTEADFS